MAAAEKGFTFEISNRGFCPAAAALEAVALDAVALDAVASDAGALDTGALELEAFEASFMSLSAIVEGGCAMAAY